MREVLTKSSKDSSGSWCESVLSREDWALEADNDPVSRTLASWQDMAAVGSVVQRITRCRARGARARSLECVRLEVDSGQPRYLFIDVYRDMGDVEGTFIIESIYPITSSESFLPRHYSVLYKICHLTSYNESIQRPMCCPTVNLYSEPWHHRVPSGSPVTRPVGINFQACQGKGAVYTKTDYLRGCIWCFMWNVNAHPWPNFFLHRLFN